MATSATAPTDKQTKLIQTIVDVAGFGVPAPIRSDKKLATTWITLTLGGLTEAEYRRMPGMLKRPEDHELDSPVLFLSSALKFEPPAQRGQQALRAWLFEIGGAGAHPDSQSILRYWQRALLYQNLNTFASDKTLAITVKPEPSKLAQCLPDLSKDFKPPRGARPGDAVALLIAFTGNASSPTALLGIPLAFDESQNALTPPACALPFFNREWLEPPDPDAPKEQYFGSVMDCDQFTEDYPPLQSPTWPEYWLYVESFVRDITGANNPLPNLAPLVGRRDTGWKVVAWDTGQASKGISNVYAAALKDSPPALLACLISEPKQAVVQDVAHALVLAGQLTGHMDTYDRSKQVRQGFGLEQTQRVAATAMTSVRSGEILTVNGPPGTGKTSFLRAVIGTACVQAALDGGQPPLMLATAATNKAVTNIIESFSEVPGLEMEPIWESRWLPGLPSYGWFYPAASKKDEEYGSFMVLRKLWGQTGEPPKNVMTAAAATFFAEQSHKRGWMLERFLDIHRQVLGLQACATDAIGAAELIRRGLADSIGRMHRLQASFKECLETPNSDPAFSESDSALARKASDLSAMLEELNTHSNTANLHSRVWNECVGQLREALRLRDARKGLLYAIRKLFVGDALGLRAQALEDATSARIADFDPSLAVSGTLLLHAVEERKLEAALQVVNINKQRRLVEQSLNAVTAKLACWADWRAKVGNVVTQLGVAETTMNEHVAEWVTAGFPSGSGLELRLEEALDMAFRFRHFHMAARYWEARWLADVPSPQDERDNLLWLQRAAMLAPVIVATVYTVPKIHKDFQFADLLIFDESGQAAAEIGAASFAFAKRAIVVGDIHQLKPVWSVGEQADRHLQTDLNIETMPQAMSASSGSVMRTAQAVTAFTSSGQTRLGAGIGLVAHYRCRAVIIDYCRRLIYGDSLAPCRREQPPNDQSDFLYPPMAWVAVQPKEAAQRDNGSWVNRDQIREIVRWLKHDSGRILAHYGKSKLSEVVALIAPFRAQANALSKAIAAELGEEEANAMVINTVHALQGAEKPIVAFSLTQDEGNFFVDRDGPNLMNVAVSRAKDCFILFAAPNIISPPSGFKSAAASGNGRHSTSGAPLAVLIDYLNEKGKRLYPREVVIIEAPGKKARVSEALGLSAHVISTGGHFRRTRAIGGKVTTEVTNPAVVQELAAVTADLRNIDCFLLATDDDDDGEEIAWHVQQVLKDQGVTDRARVRRMRFYSLTPQDIRLARELALPGIDARRVRANLVRGLFDEALHQKLRTAGIKATRPQIALLREIQQRSYVPGQWRLKVSGRVDGLSVTGYVLDQANVKYRRPQSFNTAQVALEFAEPLHLGSLAQLTESEMRQITMPRYPAGTTAQTLIAAYRRYGWEPARTMEALKALYLGQSQTKAFGVGYKDDDQDTTETRQ